MYICHSVVFCTGLYFSASLRWQNSLFFCLVSLPINAITAHYPAGMALRCPTQTTNPNQTAKLITYRLISISVLLASFYFLLKTEFIWRNIRQNIRMFITASLKKLSKKLCVLMSTHHRNTTITTSGDYQHYLLPVVVPRF